LGSKELTVAPSGPIINLLASEAIFLLQMEMENGKEYSMALNKNTTLSELSSSELSSSEVVRTQCNTQDHLRLSLRDI
jgi:FtsZ-binding cell division protein ZapB